MKLADREYCTGCAACANVCLKSAIEMLPDSEGFLQPVIDAEKCVSCGACERACSIVSEPRFRPVQIQKNPLCGISNDLEVWRESTSGGAFTEICKSLFDYDPVVFGARFSANGNVTIDFVESVADIGAFRKSKYVQAEVGLSMRKCRDFLTTGRKVVFSGTPCMIAGLRTFLAKDYTNLLTIEFICHGVGSPKVFNDCIKAMSYGWLARIVKYGFRSKVKWPNSSPYVSIHELLVAGIFRCTRLVSSDLYNRLFLNQLCLRRSCMEHCHFRDPNRYADITLADCRSERELYPDKDDKNWSVIVANTERGKSVVDRLNTRMNLLPYSEELLKRTNPLYYHTTKGNSNRSRFFVRWTRGDNLLKIAHELVPDERDHWIKWCVKSCLRFAMRCARYFKRKIIKFLIVKSS